MSPVAVAQLVVLAPSAVMRVRLAWGWVLAVKVATAPVARVAMPMPMVVTVLLAAMPAGWA
ncbi:MULTISPECIES: hypothetical protein [Halomonadaceae]|uniref:hypothetical protein n=1 Tax=Halomonadaceae TaxID=28256 RepID=UPI0015EC883E|nr:MULTISPECIES: hypothetical protein [Halomonas]